MIGYSNEVNKKAATGTISLPDETNSYRVMIPYVLELYEKIVEKNYPIRRLSVTCNDVGKEVYEQYNLFTDYKALERDKRLQKATLEIKQKFGKNAIVRGMDLQEAATARARNKQIGGHESGEDTSKNG